MIDVGSHAATWSIAMAKYVPNGKVYGFEASSYYSRVSRLFLQLLSKKNIIIINKAVIDCIKEVYLMLADNKNKKLTGSNYIEIEKNDKQEIHEKIYGVSLDSFFKNILENNSKKISFIKIDVEGAEILALKGAYRIITKFNPFIIVEICKENMRNLSYKHKDVFKYMSDLGYKPFVSKYFIKEKKIQINELLIENYRGCNYCLCERDSRNR